MDCKVFKQIKIFSNDYFRACSIRSYLEVRDQINSQDEISFDI